MRPAHHLAPLLMGFLFAAPQRALAADSDPTQPWQKRWAVGFNPLAMAIGRFGFDLEYVASQHLVLLMNAHGDYASKDLPAIEYDRPTPVWGFGGEAGLRWFTRGRSMRGYFLGASIVFGSYSVEYYGRRVGLPGAGLAVDMGGQIRLGGPLFLTLGGGLQHLWTARYPADIAPGVSWVMGAGLAPRVLVTLGVVLP